MLIGRVYDLIVNDMDLFTSWAANKPFAQLATPAGTSIEILQIEFGQRNVEASMQNGLWIAKRSAATTLAAGVVPQNLSPDGPLTLLTGTTTTCAAGISGAEGAIETGINLYSRYVPFNQLNGVNQRYLETPIKLPASKFITFSLTEASAAAGDKWCLCVRYREL